MNASKTQLSYLFSALPCEAKPLISYYKLKKNLSIQPFEIYSNDETVLTVTGIGKPAMAAGVAFTQALFPSRNPTVMLNIGIAGHRDYLVGSVFLAGKITDGDSGRRFYPPLVFSPSCPTDSLITFSKPQNDYPQTGLCDMEASAFYEIATRFTSGELAQCMKIVSDNTSGTAENITPAMVSALIETQLPVIDSILSELNKLAASVAEPELPGYDAILGQYRFSANERMQLKKSLSRRQIIKGQESIEITAASGKEFLRKLTEDLDQADFYL